jgi:hypothetical protein
VIGADPVSMDIGLERLLSQVRSIASTEDDFIRWKVSVVGRYEAHVEQKGIETARVADDRHKSIKVVFEGTMSVYEEPPHCPS